MEYKNETTGFYEAATGKNGAPNVRIKGGRANDMVPITPNDSTVITETIGIYVGVSGNVAVTMASGTDRVIPNLAAGVIHSIAATKIKATGTTATSIMAVY